MGEDGQDAAAPTETITVKLVGQGREEMLFKVKKTTKMSKIMESYAGRVGQPLTSLRFMFDGTKVSPDSTPKMMEMEDNDQIDVVLEQIGGYQ